MLQSSLLICYESSHQCQLVLSILKQLTAKYDISTCLCLDPIMVEHIICCFFIFSRSRFWDQIRPQIYFLSIVVTNQTGSRSKYFIPLIFPYAFQEEKKKKRTRLVWRVKILQYSISNNLSYGGACFFKLRGLLKNKKYPIPTSLILKTTW